jgi:hypothetical protein
MARKQPQPPKHKDRLPGKTMPRAAKTADTAKAKPAKTKSSKSDGRAPGTKTPTPKVT